MPLRQVADQPAGAGADDRAAEDRGREDDPDQRADPGARPGAVLRRLLGLRHPDLAVVLLTDHRRVEGPDRTRGMQVEHGLVVGLGVVDLVVDGGVEKHRSVGHVVPFQQYRCLVRRLPVELRGLDRDIERCRWRRARSGVWCRPARSSSSRWGEIRDASPLGSAWRWPLAEAPFGLVEVKLAAPMSRQGNVAKVDVVARLCTSTLPLVTVVGPAGYGKTTLLAPWDEADPRPSRGSRSTRDARRSARRADLVRGEHAH